MMFIFKHKIICYIIGIVSLVLIFLIIDHIFDLGFMKMPKGQYIKAEMRVRIMALGMWRSALKEYLKDNPQNTPDLYKTYCFIKNKYQLDLRVVVYPTPGVPCGETEIAANSNKFYQFCQYEIVKLTGNSWGIVELSNGYFLKQFLIITESGAVYIISQPIVDHQKEMLHDTNRNQDGDLEFINHQPYFFLKPKSIMELQQKGILIPSPWASSVLSSLKPLDQIHS